MTYLANTEVGGSSPSPPTLLKEQDEQNARDSVCS